MTEKFYVECDRCKEDVEFTINDVDDLRDHIDSEISDAESTARRETETEFDEYVEVGDLTGCERHLWELSAAIRRGDRETAELHLDRLAEKLGTRAVEEVQQARFGRLAKAA